MHATATTTTFHDVSPPRIVGWSTALALHALAFALLVMPSHPPLADLLPTPDTAIEAVIVREVVVQPEPVPEVPPPPRRETVPRETPVAPVVPVQLIESALPFPVAMAPLAPRLEPAGEPAVPAATQGAQIAYEHAPPPPYPGLAQRRGWEGDVLLRVRVGADGRPREVVVERSSGRSLLDRAASEHVLAKWRFHPALQDGREVDAWARVPISFRIERL